MRRRQNENRKRGEKSYSKSMSSPRTTAVSELSRRYCHNYFTILNFQVKSKKKAQKGMFKI
jgi:hypothetical protein